MPTPDATAGPVARFLRRLAEDELRDRPDGDLLARFAATRDEAAFAVVVRRHGPMVIATAGRVAGAADAEDVGQAVFLLLARQAARFPAGASAGGWLHAVAVRTALKARSRGHRHRAVEVRAARPEAVPPAAPDDVTPLVDRAVRALPTKLRDAVVLCELEGVPRRQAADRLGVPVGTLSSRLAAAHRRLAAKLGRLAGLAAAGTASERWAEATMAAVFSHDSRAVPAAVSVLVTEVTRMIWLGKLKLAAAGVCAAVAVGAAGVGVGVRATADEPKKEEIEAVFKGRVLSEAFKKRLNAADIAREKRRQFHIAELAKLEGVWRAVSATLDDAPTQLDDYEKSMSFEFAQDGQCVIRDVRTDLDRPRTSRIQGVDFEITPHRTPKELFFFERYGAYIYEVEGDTLRLGSCRWSTSFDRPHGFKKADQPPGSPQVYVRTLKRDKPTAK